MTTRDSMTLKPLVLVVEDDKPLAGLMAPLTDRGTTHVTHDDNLRVGLSERFVQRSRDTTRGIVVGPPEPAGGLVVLLYRISFRRRSVT
jgi:hypothetical protein